MVLQTHDPERRMSKVESTAEIVVHCFAFEKASGQTPLLGTGMHRLQSKQSSTNTFFVNMHNTLRCSQILSSFLDEKF